MAKRKAAQSAKTTGKARTATAAQLQKWSAPYRDLDRDFWGFRMTDPAHKQLVAEAIQASGMSISDFLRAAALDFARRSIQKSSVAR